MAAAALSGEKRGRGDRSDGDGSVDGPDRPF
jgi:hypothetical protein